MSKGNIYAVLCNFELTGHQPYDLSLKYTKKKTSVKLDTIE